jgi:hypothetical protein
MVKHLVQPEAAAAVGSSTLQASAADGLQSSSSMGSSGSGSSSSGTSSRGDGRVQRRRWTQPVAARQVPGYNSGPLLQSVAVC